MYYTGGKIDCTLLPDAPSASAPIGYLILAVGLVPGQDRVQVPGEVALTSAAAADLAARAAAAAGNTITECPFASAGCFPGENRGRSSVSHSADIDALHQRINQLEQHNLDLQQQLDERDDDLAAAQSVETALATGYRSIDTAAGYGNERGVGRAITASGIPRSELFITTKVIDREGYDHTIASAHASLERLGTDYLDLYLIHWPFDEAMTETWQAMQDLHAADLVRAIGVSNFGAARLDRLVARTAVVPAVNQIELHPRFAQTTLRNYCHGHGITVQSWSPLQQGGELLTHPVIAGIATAHGCAPAQIVLRWHVQHGLVVIPRSTSPEHIRANTAIFDFELTTPEMVALDSLDAGQRANPIADPETYVFTDETYNRLQAIND